MKITTPGKHRIISLARSPTNWGSFRIWNHLNRVYSRAGIIKLIAKWRATGTVVRTAGSGRPRTIRNPIMSRHVCRQLLFGDSQREVGRELEISKSTVFRIKKDAGLKCFKKINVQYLSVRDKRLRLQRCNIMLQHLQDKPLPQWFFSDEKMFHCSKRGSAQNTRVYCRQHVAKCDINNRQLLKPTKSFTKGIMVWACCSRTHKLPLIWVAEGIKINAATYMENILQEAIPIMRRLSPAGFFFQQDGAPSHRAAATQQYLRRTINNSFLLADQWPPNSPDCNPLDYRIWGAMEQIIYANNRIFPSVHELHAAVEDAWAALSDDFLCHVIEEFPTRIHKVVDVRGEHIEQFFQ